MRRSAVRSRARALGGLGLAVAVLAGGVGTAAPNEVTRCSTTVCAVAGAQVVITCSHPDAKTVQCQGIATVWGTGRVNSAAGVPGTLDWRGDGRCGGSCDSNQLAQGAAAWNGVTSRSASVLKVLVFPPESRTSATRTCFLYTLGVTSVATARSIAPLSINLDGAEASNTDYKEVYACNTV